MAIGAEDSRSVNQDFCDRMPAAMIYDLNDECHSILKLNSFFLTMLGFTRKELNDRFHNQLAPLVHSDDRCVFLRAGTATLPGETSISNYRLITKSGSYRRVLESRQLLSASSGEPYYVRIIIPLPENLDESEELRLSLERHKIILEQTTDIIFEWDFPTDTLNFSANWQKKFGYEPLNSGVLDKLPASSNIHPDDWPVLGGLMDRVRQGVPYSTVELRFRDAGGKYIWCRVRATDQYDRNGVPFKSIGIISDIDTEKQLMDSLRKRAERDALTGLFNREETEYRIKRCLLEHPSSPCAMLMIDTDNFKQVNDTKGHLFGDAVLTEMAAAMKRLTRSSDIVGRIGGDEFTIFLRDISSPKDVELKIHQMQEMFQKLFDHDKNLFQITSSIGIALYPEDGEDFQTLYHSADQALYQAKNQGKNQYVFYSKKEPWTAGKDQSLLGTAIDSDLKSLNVSSDLANYVFQILYDSTDVDRTVNLLLEIIGKRFDVSRAYVFENTDDGRYCDNTYEWCNTGIDPEINNLQHLSYSELDHFETLYADSPIFYCRDIDSLVPTQRDFLKKQGIRSTLQCAFYEGQVFSGFIGYDECTGTRLWTKEEIGSLALVARLLSTFLQRNRSCRSDNKILMEQTKILDLQDHFIYLIDPGTYTFLFLNRALWRLDQDLAPGMTCYKALYHREHPCDHCPLGSGKQCEVFHPGYEKWFQVSGKPLTLGEDEAYMVSCFDVSKYVMGRD